MRRVGGKTAGIGAKQLLMRLHDDSSLLIGGLNPSRSQESGVPSPEELCDADLRRAEGC